MRAGAAMRAMILFLAAAGGCRTAAPPRYSPPPIAAARGSGQIPPGVLSGAVSGHPARSGERAAPSAAAFSEADGEITLVLGPLVIESGGRQGAETGDGGLKIREVIAQALAGAGNIILVDAPNESRESNSPRPDLAGKGIRYLIEGNGGVNAASGEATVFLRGVATQTGQVEMISSGRDRSAELAASAAVKQMIAKLKGVQP